MRLTWNYLCWQWKSHRYKPKLQWMLRRKFQILKKRQPLPELFLCKHLKRFVGESRSSISPSIFGSSRQVCITPSSSRKKETDTDLCILVLAEPLFRSQRMFTSTSPEKWASWGDKKAKLPTTRVNGAPVCNLASSWLGILRAEFWQVCVFHHRCREEGKVTSG